VDTLAILEETLGMRAVAVDSAQTKHIEIVVTRTVAWLLLMSAMLREEMAVGIAADVIVNL